MSYVSRLSYECMGSVIVDGVGFTVARDDAWYKRNDEASRVFIHSFAFAS